MVDSFDLRLKTLGYTANSYKIHKFDNEHFLVTTDHGAWIVLNKKEYELLRLNKVDNDKKLLDLLYDKKIILNDENIDKLIDDMQGRFHFLFSGPSLHIITPTLRCPSSCVYCHSSSKPLNAKGYDMDEKTAKAVVDFIFKSSSRNITIEFQGGEPLLKPDIIKFILNYAVKSNEKAKKNLKFALVTNMAYMNDELLESFKTFDKNRIGLCTSLDGPKKVHDKNRFYLNGTSSYNDTVYWIKRIKQKYKHYFLPNALATITKYSLNYGKEIVDEYVRLGLKYIWLRPINKLGEADKNWNEIGYSAEEFIKFWNKQLDYIIQLNKEGVKIREMMALYITAKIMKISDSVYTELMSPCGAAIAQLLYDYKGDIYTCDEAKILDIFRIGNVFKSSYNDIFKSKTTISVIDTSTKLGFLCDACPWSPYCSICPVYNYVSERTLVSILPQNERCKIFRAMIESIFKRLIFSKKDREVLLAWIE